MCFSQSCSSEFFIFSGASICSAMVFRPLGNSDHVVVSVSIDFLTNSKQDVPFHRIAYSRADWEGLRDHLRDVPWENIFKLSASAAASKFCGWIQVAIYVIIPLRKYQAKPYSSSWFSAAWASAIVHRNHFFCSYQQNKSSKSSGSSSESSDRLVIVAKGLLKLSNLHMLLKQKSLSLPRNVALATLGELLIAFST